MNLVITCKKCGKKLELTNVTEVTGTQSYTVGCIPCGRAHQTWDSGGTIHSSTVPAAANQDTTVNRT
jgi:uncharacterized Zn finger protein